MRLLYCSFLWLLASCVKDLPYPPDVASKKVVVNCLLSNVAVQTLTLNYSNAMGSTGRLFTEVPQATITLYENGNAVGTFTKDGYATWKLNYLPQVAAAYTLTVAIPDKPEIKATTIMPAPAAVSYNSVANYGFTKTFTQQSLNNTYWFFCLNNNIPTLTPLPMPPAEGERLQDIVGTSHSHTDRFNQEGNTTLINPIGNTPAYKYYVRVPADTAAAPFTFTVQSNHGKRSYVVFRSASKEYDEYMKTTLVKMFLYQSADDPIRWFDENVVYSNLSHALGIFGAYYQTYFQFN